MFIKTATGKFYVNSDQIVTLCVGKASDSSKITHYYVQASMNANGASIYPAIYVLGKFDTEIEADSALECFIAKINGHEPASTPELPLDVKNRIAEVAARAAGRAVAPRKQSKAPNYAAELLVGELKGLTDDFLASGDSDYLIKINAYIRAYLEQEAKNE